MRYTLTAMAGRSKRDGAEIGSGRPPNTVHADLQAQYGPAWAELAEVRIQHAKDGCDHCIDRIEDRLFGPIKVRVEGEGDLLGLNRLAELYAGLLAASQGDGAGIIDVEATEVPAQEAKALTDGRNPGG